MEPEPSGPLPDPPHPWRKYPECRGPVIHEERSATVRWSMQRFLEHLRSEAHHNGSARAYVEDTYLYSADPTYLNLARNRGSAGLHRLEPDLPQPLGTVPRFPVLERLEGLPCSAIALFVGNGSESSMHQDVNEMNFITQVSGCKHVITAPPEASAVIGLHPQGPNDALLDTTALSKWGGIEEQQHQRLQMRGRTSGSSNDEEEDEEDEEEEEPPSLTLCDGAVRVPGAQYHRLCAGDALFLPNSTWHALYGDPVPEASSAPSMTVTFFFSDGGGGGNNRDGTS
jgi:hypothetical protein